MSVIAVVNRKGGSGKSTLATHIAAYCALRGAAVAIADIDRQQSTRAWLRQRKAQLAGEAMRITAWNVDPRSFVRPPVGIDHVVIDTPGGLTGLDLARVVMYADALVVPIGASIFDRESAAACLAELRTLPRVASGRCRVGAIGMRVEAHSDSAEALLGWSREQRAEAEAVRDLLKGRGYEVLPLIGPDAKTNAILNAFFGKDYRIIHIAGHGAYDRADPRRTGVVIGDDQYLTAGTIQQLEVVPDLVFLNCCHLARTDAGEVPPPAYGQPQAPWNLLAASVSEALIRIGVRAVVAAGWAVNDKAARFFAEQLYHLMLSGTAQGFGRAVFEARRNLLDHPDFGVTTNAWGAYQCYGDPGFTLRRQPISVAMAPVQPVAAHEIVRELRDIERNARRPASDGPDGRQGYLNRVLYLAGITPVDWRTGEMLYSLAAALGELGAFEQAIEYYKQAIASPNFQEQVPLAAVEQLANLQVRYAEQLRRDVEARRQAGPLDASQAAQIEQKRANLQDDAMRRLERLLAVAETPERMALMGSWYKRKFTAATGSEREALLKNGQRWYGKAHAASQGKELNPYHTLNWVAFRVFDPRSSRPAAQLALRDLIARSERTIRQRAPAQRDFWAWVTTPDAAVLRALIDQNLAQQLETITGQYQAAFSHGASERQRNSVLQHLDFLIAAATWRSETESRLVWTALTGSLQELRIALAE